LLEGLVSGGATAGEGPGGTCRRPLVQQAPCNLAPQKRAGNACSGESRPGPAAAAAAAAAIAAAAVIAIAIATAAAAAATAAAVIAAAAAAGPARLPPPAAASSGWPVEPENLRQMAAADSAAMHEQPWTDHIEPHALHGLRWLGVARKHWPASRRSIKRMCDRRGLIAVDARGRGSWLATSATIGA
jgi:hypothetical protein